MLRGLARQVTRLLRERGVDVLDFSSVDSTVAVKVVRAGKALYIGASSMFAYQFSRMLHKADALGRTTNKVRLYVAQAGKAPKRIAEAPVGSTARVVIPARWSSLTRRPWTVRLSRSLRPRACGE